MILVLVWSKHPKIQLNSFLSWTPEILLLCHELQKSCYLFGTSSHTVENTWSIALCDFKFSVTPIVLNTTYILYLLCIYEQSYSQSSVAHFVLPVLVLWKGVLGIPIPQSVSQYIFAFYDSLHNNRMCMIH